MRLRLLAPFAFCFGVAAAAHADTVSVFDLNNQAGSGRVGTITIDTTTGVVTGINASLSLNGATETFDVAPEIQGYSPLVNEYEATFAQGGNEFLFETPILYLVGFAPANRAACRTMPVDCDYLANVFNGPISSADRVETFEGNLGLASTTSVAPEPASMLLLGTGLLCMAALARRRLV